ncbi:DUF1800 domain-containing protein [Methylobacterium sp. CM6247]
MNAERLEVQAVQMVINTPMETPHPFLVATGRFGLGMRTASGRVGKDPRGEIEASLSSPALPDYGRDLKSSVEQLQTMQRRRSAVAAIIADKVSASRKDDGNNHTMSSREPPLETMGSPTMGGSQGLDGSNGMRPSSSAREITASGVPRTVPRSNELDAWLLSTLENPAPFKERLALYWSNHFTVSAVKAKVGLTVGPYQREAIRPHVLGSFQALLLAAITHPAMLFYLDNDISIGPNSDIGKRKRSGLNENLAREVLELHTLGTQGGYTQADVTAFAAVLTGWQVELRLDNEHCGRTFFDPRRHEPGAKRLLGKTYPDIGEGQLLAVVRDLAANPATARHVATRFAGAFVSSPPPFALVESLERSFLSTDGDLTALALTLVRSDAAWSIPLRKLRPPIEFMAATTNLLGVVPRRPRPDLTLVAMGQPFLTAPSPKGWPEDDDGWATSDGIKTRLDWTQEVASRHAKDVDIKSLVNDTLIALLSDETRTEIMRAETREQALTILLMSPDFQRR